ncbi:MAG TPA: hypothetical protein VGM06_06010 [Polyangiaceae bacterium]|jgi:hypothetical protein
MTIQGPNSFFDVAGTYASVSASPASAVDASGSNGATAVTAAPPSTVRVSPWAHVLGKLQQLHDDAPATFKVAVGQMADSVKQAADNADADKKQDLLKLSQKLADAAKTGDLTVFKPTHHHHSRHPASVQAGSPSQGTPNVLQSLLDQIDHVLGPDANAAGSS